MFITVTAHKILCGTIRVSSLRLPIKFRFDMIFISAGFDAHQDDPLANLNFTEDDFVWLTLEICKLADRHSDGRIVSTLEGGYDLDALAASTAAHVKVLMEQAS